MGSAVLYTVDSTLDPVDVDDYAEEAAGTLAPVLEAMVVFASPPGVSDIPADFPLDLDQVAMTGDGGEMRGPSPDEAGLGALELCGTSPWLDVPADRLASTATGPEYADVRELRVYGSADDAVVQMTRLRGLLDDCADEPVESGGRLVHAADRRDHRLRQRHLGRLLHRGPRRRSGAVHAHRQGGAGRLGGW